MLPGKFHQGQMTLVQITHRGDKRYAQLPSQLITQLFNGVYNLQYILRIRRAVSSNCRAGIGESHIDRRIGLRLRDFKQ